MAALSIYELSDPYENIMLNPAAPGRGVCPICRTFHDPAYPRCGGCSSMPRHLVNAVVPITYSVNGEQVAHELWAYKNVESAAVQRQLMRGLASVLWRFLDEHEVCVAEAARHEGLFDIVTTVPSKTKARDAQRPNLRTIVSDLCEHTAGRYERLLWPTDASDSGREFDPTRYVCSDDLHGRGVLLIDDTWTRGASVYSAAHALRGAGADVVAAVPIGRHIRPEHEPEIGVTNEKLLRALPTPFDWDTCAVH